MKNYILCIIVFFISFLLSFVTTPLCRFIAVKLNIIDNPISDIKTHKIKTPYLGGIAIALGWAASLILIRIITNFPTLTLRNIRGLIYGALMVSGLGLVDDIKFKGLGFKSKLIIQFLAAATVVFLFDIRINFISIYWISCFISIVWMIGITNAFNILDIIDGLSSGIALIASLAFLFISLPTKMIYVNFCSIALAGAILGFLPFNLSNSKKIFMGDTGSLFIGFILASIAMGTSYTSVNEIGLFAPLIILVIPIYETILVSFFRIKKGRPPFLGSKDHYALRLEKMGFSRKKILLITYTACIIFSICAYLFTKLDILYAMFLFAAIIVCIWAVSIKLATVRID
ncbi:MAG: undecaprenyl/decaprenyl-phosphate alpha-N-acetylglucosaminyl 1-phosphate transferase [Endomicrobium sp.]|jgi:UDP-GlcNAc:undecaprenyl-phosphate GlcNAc-1-phosphate transferase|nr:undecaprenyl/decaprenyl-phosphate alpha-N-acetylglucosaminyl 1-phosphate transferase [Endomicrobium sp.]